MTQACVQAKGLNLAQGVCDTPVPPVVLRAAAQAMERGKNVYSRFDGLPELRQAIAKKLAQYNGILADPETEVTVSAGATGSFHCACLALLNPGDEVILFEPFYQYHISALLAVGSDGGQPLSDDEILGFCYLLLVGGNDTTTNLIANGMLLLAQHPDQRADLVAHPELLPGAIEDHHDEGQAL